MRRVLLFAVLALLPVAAEANVAKKIALEGEASPGGNGLFTGFSPLLHLTENGKVVFYATTDDPVPAGATSAGCLFRYDVDGSNGTALLCNGDAVGLPGWDTWTAVEVGGVDRRDVNRVGDIAFVASAFTSMGFVSGSTFHLSSAGVLTDLGFADADVQINDANDVLINGLDLHITSPGGPLVPIQLENDPLPDDPTLFSVDTPAGLGEAGDVAIAMMVTPAPSGPPFSFVYYLWDAGVFTRLAANTYGPLEATGEFPQVEAYYTPGGRILAGVGDGSGFLAAGWAEWDGASWLPVVLPRPGESIPMSPFSSGTAGLSRATFFSLESGVAGPVCMVLGTGPRARQRPIRAGDVVAEGTIQAVASRAAISSTRFAAQVTLDDLASSQGIYVTAPSKVPSLQLAMTCALASLLALAGAWRLARPR